MIANLSSLLSHPFVVLLAGAALSGGLWPWFTRRWQDHQKALEIKTQLVTEISEAVMTFVLTVQFFHLEFPAMRARLHENEQQLQPIMGPDFAGAAQRGDSDAGAELTEQRKRLREQLTERQDKLNQAYAEWAVQGAVIGTKLRACFPNERACSPQGDLPGRWTDFADVLTQFYALEGTPDEAQRAQQIERLLERLQSIPSLTGAPSSCGGDRWGRLQSEILRRKADMIRWVLRSRIGA